MMVFAGSFVAKFFSVGENGCAVTVEYGEGRGRGGMDGKLYNGLYNCDNGDNGDNLTAIFEEGGKGVVGIDTIDDDDTSLSLALCGPL